jgi:photosystem II stability/assembly factor-like uncharacterized protein
MPHKKLSPSWPTLIFAIAALAMAACHREVKVPPLVERNITLNDIFFDVWPTSPERALVVGARGKLLVTEDGGRHFKRIKLGTDLAIFGVQMADAENGYLCGQDGLIMRTRDGGNTWERLNSRTHLYILSLSFPDRLHGFFVGDQSLVLSTTNGGETFFKRRLERIFPEELQDYALPYMEPILYAVDFVDPTHGWIVGEMGRIWSTDNGGTSWNEEQASLLSQWKRPPAVNEDPRLRDLATLPSFFGVSFRDLKQGAASGLEGSIIATNDGGKTWTFQKESPKPGAPPDGMIPGAPQIPAHDPLFGINLFDANEGMATGLTGTVLRQQPDGVWAHDPSVPSLPLPLSQVRFFDAQHGWIVGYGTILYTEDGGKTWRACQG